MNPKEPLCGQLCRFKEYTSKIGVGVKRTLYNFRKNTKRHSDRFGRPRRDNGNTILQKKWFFLKKIIHENGTVTVRVVLTFLISRKDSKDQESIQSSTTPIPAYQMGK